MPPKPEPIELDAEELDADDALTDDDGSDAPSVPPPKAMTAAERYARYADDAAAGLDVTAEAPSTLGSYPPPDPEAGATAEEVAAAAERVIAGLAVTAPYGAGDEEDDEEGAAQALRDWTVGDPSPFVPPKKRGPVRDDGPVPTGDVATPSSRAPSASAERGAELVGGGPAARAPVPIRDAEAAATDPDEPPRLVQAGASQLPPAPTAALEAIAAAVDRLRAEVGATSDKARKARLLGEAGEIQERGGDESGAARDYLAAYNADPSFREPLEGLLRLLERRRTLSNLGKLIEALVTSAVTPEERARALTQRAIFFEDVQKDLEGARGAAREATETGAGPADLGPAYLALEMVAAKLDDRAERREALTLRADNTTEPTWRGLLLVDAADLAAREGELDRALALLARARGEDAGAAWTAAVTTERVIASDPGLPGSEEAAERSRALAESFEARADMIGDALADASAGDRRGVPRHVRSVPHVVDHLLRADAARRAAGDSARSAALLDRALAVLAEAKAKADAEASAPSASHAEAGVETGDGARVDRAEADASTEANAPPRATGADAARDAARGLATLERVVLTARLRLAESVGDTALASTLAERRLEGETDGGVAAALAMRVAEHAASEGDIARALEALTTATDRDPLSAPARALKIDVLEGGDDPARFAAEIETFSQHCVTGEAQGRALLLAAYVWATRANDAERAREALGQAAACGVGKEVVARFARSLASLRGDDTWYEAATRGLVETSPPAAELPLLWVELARARLAQGDEAGFARATAALRDLDGGAWLGRVLEGFVGPEVDPARARSAVEELAGEVSDPALRRSLVLVCALRAQTSGDGERVLRHLEDLAADDPSDPLVAAFLGDVLRLRNAPADRAAAAERALAAAEAAADDPERAAARLLEAGFEKWRRDERPAAIAAFEAAAPLTPSAEPALAWALRGVEVDVAEGRRRALERATPDASVALERFALEATAGDPDDAAQALANVDIAASGDLRLAGALARLVWAKGATERDAVSAALDTLAATGEGGRKAAAAERLRVLREDAEASPAEVADAARGWLDVGGGGAAAVEWIAAAMSGGDAAAEVPARRALAAVLADESREALDASATLLEWTLARVRDAAEEPKQGFVSGTSLAVRLANLELAPPGCDPRKRASALSELDGALGEEADVDALGLAAWSALAAGDAAAALDVFRAVTSARPDDLPGWEGLRTAAEHLRDHESYGVACEQLGARCASAERGAAFWEQAALAWLRLANRSSTSGAKELPLTDAAAAYDQRAEAALDASFARDPTRAVAFDKLFRRVRDRKDHDKLLAIANRRLEVTEDTVEMAKMYWEMARAFREKGDPDSALEALEQVKEFDENHVGALALTGEILIRRGMFAEAAESLAHLARIDSAPPKNRVTAGVAAVDLYENKLGRHDRALEVLVALHAAKLTTLPVRERLARSAARTGSWTEATLILEELMNERPERDGRIEAARLAMVIHRDRLGTPASAVPALRKLLDESPTDGEALDFATTLDASVPERRRLLERGRDSLLMALHEAPQNVDANRRLARVAHHLGDGTLEQAALSCALALGGPDGASEQMIALLSAKKPRVPQTALTDAMIRQVLAPGDDGPIADLFHALGPTLAEALGPTRNSLGVTKKDRVDPKAGIALRHEIAQWANAFGIQTFDLYVGGRDPGGVTGIAGDPPAIVVGSGVNAPLSPMTRARVARELLSISRGTTVTRWKDDTTIAAIVVAACQIVKVPFDASALGVLAEIERLIAKAIPRKTKAAIEPICRALAQRGQDARQWAARARASQSRFATVASGDVSVVLADLFGEPLERAHAVARDDLRAHDLLRFVLSRPYFDLRRALGLEG